MCEVLHINSIFHPPRLEISLHIWVGRERQDVQSRCVRAFFHFGVPFVSHLGSRLKEDIVDASAVPLHLVHRRLAHAGMPKLKATIKGMGLEAKNEDFHCEACALGKSKRIISRAKQERALKAGDFFHFDIQDIRPAGRWVDKGGRTISGFEYAHTVQSRATLLAFDRHKRQGQKICEFRPRTWFLTSDLTPTTCRVEQITGTWFWRWQWRGWKGVCDFAVFGL